MPEIAPATPATPLLPMTSAAAPQAITSAVAPIAADGSVQDFLGQLKAALKSLAGAVKAQADAPQLQLATPAAAPTEPAPIASDKPAAPKTDDEKPSDALPELLAALGFVVVPSSPITPEPAKAQVAAAPTSDRQPATTRVSISKEVPVASTLTEPVPAAPATEPQKYAQTTPQPQLQLPNDVRATPPTPPTPSHTAEASVPQSTEKKPIDPSAPPVHVDAPTIAAPDTHQAQPAATTPASSPTPTTPTPTTAVQAQVQPGGGTFDQGSHSEDGRRHHDTAPVASVTETTSTPTGPAIDQTLATVTATAAAANTAAVLANVQVHPGEVVSQIAHQADLYRLPGNKGVRINLHPDDLGGVQVTLRYAAGGSLELHINVEHATTGALVQAGWTELRDALATQGIGPDRLVMSITGPSGANELDLSSNGGGSNRPDSGATAFTQGGDSGQQRQDNGGGADNARGARGWNVSADSPSVSDDAPRSASATAASRIDYRV